jgi:hypothetical protein
MTSVGTQRTAGSPLLNLAPELRNRIYELALQNAEPIVIPEWDGRTKAFQSRGWGCLGLGLTATCKQIRAETLAMFYTINEFQLEGLLQGFDDFIAFKRAIGPQNTAFLRRVIIAGNKGRAISGFDANLVDILQRFNSKTEDTKLYPRTCHFFLLMQPALDVRSSEQPVAPKYLLDLRNFRQSLETYAVEVDSLRQSCRNEDQREFIEGHHRLVMDVVAVITACPKRSAHMCGHCRELCRKSGS